MKSKAGTRLSLATHRFGRFLAVLWGLVIIAVCVASAGAQDPPTTPLPLIRSGAEIGFPPFSLVDSNGRANGFSVELLRAAMAAMGCEVSFDIGPWYEVRGWLERGEIQALPLVGRTPEREMLFDFTFPYMSLHGAIVVRDETEGIHRLSDLEGKEVAVMKGDNAEEFLKREDRNITIVTTPTFEDALRELSRGRYDAVVIQRLLALRLIQETGLTNLQIVDRPIESYRQEFCFAVREGDRDTLALLNEGLALVIADGTYRRLHAKWFAALQLPSDRPLVIGGDYNYPPFEYLDEKGQPAGFTVELTRAIANEMNMDIRIRLGPWAQRIDDLKNEKIDAIQRMSYSVGRDRTLEFSPPYLVFYYVSVVRRGHGKAPGKVADLVGRSLAVRDGDVILEFLTEYGLKDEISLLETEEDVLLSVSEGRYECALAPRIIAIHLIEKNGWENLELSSQSIFSGQYAYAVADGHPALTAQFSEGLKILKEKGEYQRIYDKWMKVYEDTPVNLFTILRYIAMVAVPLMALLAVFVLWSWSLRKQVALKTRELRESVDRFKYIFEAANVGKLITQLTGEINANKAFGDFLGYTADELQGKKWHEITPAEDIDAIETLMAPLLTGEKNAVRFEKRYIHKNGNLLWGDASLAIRRNDAGEPLYFVITVVDITDRKRTQDKLRESENRYRLLAENTLDVIWTMTLDFEFTYVNPAITLLSHHTPEEWIGSRLADHCDKENFAQITQIATEELKKGPESSGVIFEAVMRKKNDTLIPIEIHGRVIYDDNRQPIRLQGTARDISERRRAEEEREELQSQLIHAQKLESVGRLAGGVAHDYNNMLSVIIGYTELAMGKLPPDAAIHEDLKEIMAAARRSADITRKLLAFARKQTIRPKVLDLNSTVENMLKMLRRLIGEDVDLAWRPGPDVWAVNIDPSQLDQVLANLCVNARDAITNVGKITIETSNVYFDQEYCAVHSGFIPGEYVLLAVSDDGHGMDKETLSNIFEPFFTTKGIGEGTGLGLATVYGIVRQNEGFINVYSEPEKGTTFRIYLPRHVGETDRSEFHSTAELPSGQGETVLIVEDEGAILKLARTILERFGYTVLHASDPVKAIDLVRTHEGPLHLLITDVVMPEMNGRDLADQLRSHYPGLKTLFMSGYTANVIAHRGVLDGGVHFLQKPFSTRQLAEKVREALDDGH